MKIEILQGDCRDVLKILPANSVHCCVTSPPYYGLRDYGTAKWEGGDAECDHKQGRNGAGRADGVVDDRAQRNRDGVGAMGGDCKKCGARRVDSQIGLEQTPDAYVAELVAVFREVRRVLRDDGTVWLNLGDSYWGGKGSNGSSKARRTANERGYCQSGGTVQMDTRPTDGKNDVIKPKDLIGIPWRVAFALQSDGWWLRQDIIWAKPNPMPESVTDRCTKSHEYIFILAKSQKYYYDADAIAEPVKVGDNGSKFDGERDMTLHPNTGRAPRKHDGTNTGADGSKIRNHTGESINRPDGKRNKRSVWTVATQPFSGSHFAVFPPALITPCILAGCPKDGTVLDPFGGSGTTGMVAENHGRNAILIELNPQYCGLIKQRNNQQVMI